MTETAKASEDVARYLAAKGAAAIAQMEAAVTRAWEIVADPDIIVEEPDWTPGPYPWEAPDDLPYGTRARIWRACVEGGATGEGHTVIFVAALARSENAFRQELSREVGRYRADAAQVLQGTAGAIAGGSKMVPLAMQAMMERLDQGDGQPATFSFVARYHANYS